MHKIHSANPPDNFKQLFTPLNQIHSYATGSATRGHSSGKQHQANTEKDLQKTSWPQNLGLY